MPSPVLELPFPPRELSPNARLHWGKKSGVAKRYRRACFVLTKKAICGGHIDVRRLREIVEDGGKVHLFMDFYMPDRRHRDDDNLISSFKSGRDGIADALKIDDRHFQTHRPFVERDNPVAGGITRVRITGRLEEGSIIGPTTTNGSE